MIGERFPGTQSALQRGRSERPSDLAIVIPAAHGDVGDITILDDGDEFTLHVGNITISPKSAMNGCLAAG